jgi:hypothetical protein
MMQWRDKNPEQGGEDNLSLTGLIELMNDQNKVIASIIWFEDEGPFYAYARNGKMPDYLKRIGPSSTLDGAKEACMAQLEGRGH